MGELYSENIQVHVTCPVARFIVMHPRIRNGVLRGESFPEHCYTPLASAASHECPQIAESNIFWSEGVLEGVEGFFSHTGNHNNHEMIF